MADLSDVENALVTYTEAALSGFNNIIVARGWPASAQLADAFKNGKSVVSIFSLPGYGRNTTRYSQEWRTLSKSPIPTLFLNYVDGTATFSGVGGANSQVVGVGISGQTWTYQVQAGDTPSTVAAALAALVPGSTQSGATLILPTIVETVVRIAALTVVFRELERQWQGFRVTAWCPTPQLRDSICSKIGSSLAETDFLLLPDGTAGWKMYEGTFLDDKATAEGLWKRDLRYRIEYATIQTMTVEEVLFPEYSLTPL